MSDLKAAKGAFAGSLLRNASKIKEDRAITIFRNAERVFKRKVEDIQAEIEDLETARAAQLDLSPTDINSLVLASDFKAEDFYKTDMEITLRIREASIRLKEAKDRYSYLFGNVAAETTVG
jgi:hypothetical protein